MRFILNFITVGLPLAKVVANALKDYQIDRQEAKNIASEAIDVLYDRKGL